MNAALERRAELLRLAQVLGTDTGRLDVLADAEPAELRALRHTISDGLMERHRETFERAAGLAGRVPAPLAASIAERAMGPVLAARVASLLGPAQAGELARRLPPAFLAQVAEHVDLRYVGPLLDTIPVETMREVARELRAHEQWVVIGALVAYLPTATVDRLLGGFDGEALLRSSLMLERSEDLDTFAAMLTDARLDEIVDAAYRHDLWAEAVWLVGELGTKQRRRIVKAIERLREEALDRLAALLLAESELREAAEPLIAIAPKHLRARIGAAA